MPHAIYLHYTQIFFVPIFANQLYLTVQIDFLILVVIYRNSIRALNLGKDNILPCKYMKHKQL